LSYLGANKNLWLAQWVYNTVTSCTWEYLRTTILPKLSMTVKTPGYADWRFLQWSSSFTLPGCAGRMDVNFYKGSKSQLYAWLGYTAPIVPDPEPEPDPDTSELWQAIDALKADRDAIAARVTALEGQAHTREHTHTPGAVESLCTFS
jgi:hypothetical protein